MRAGPLAAAVASVIAIVAAGAAAAQSPGGPPPGATVIDGRKAGLYVEINGKRNPDQLPEYLVWRSALRSLAELSARDLTHLVAEMLPLSAEEKPLVYQAARQQLERDDACARQQTDRSSALTKEGVPFATVIEAMKPIVMECRQQVLDAQERLLAALRPETRMALTAWVNSKRDKIHALVPRQDLADFRKPR